MHVGRDGSSVLNVKLDTKFMESKGIYCIK